ncbi:hypothetical protein Dimus_039775 [Dionaea muscipula]
MASTGRRRPKKEDGYGDDSTYLQIHNDQPTPSYTMSLPILPIASTPSLRSIHSSIVKIEVSDAMIGWRLDCQIEHGDGYPFQEKEECYEETRHVNHLLAP